MGQTGHPDDVFLALDIGGTNITAGLIIRSGQVILTESFPTQSEHSPSALINAIVSKLKGLMNQAKINHPLALGIGAPGWLKPQEGLIIVAPNMPGWKDVPIASILSQALNMPARLENDANLYALGEWLAGSGQGCQNEITLTLGTGVGGGLILEGRLWNGSFSSSAEVGHIPINSGVVCGCGRKGCLETVASATGMIRLAREWLKDGKETIYQESPESLNPKIMLNLAKNGDPMSLSVFKQAGTALGLVLAGVFNLLSLERAVIGGGAAGAYEFIAPALLDTLSTHLVTAQIQEISVVKGQLDTMAPLVGAAALLSAAGF